MRHRFTIIWQFIEIKNKDNEIAEMSRNYVKVLLFKKD